jgi:hypothetical protein
MKYGYYLINQVKIRKIIGYIDLIIFLIRAGKIYNLEK